MRDRLPSYARILRLFVAGHADDAARLRALLAQGDVAVAQLLTHSLKGSADKLNEILAKAERGEGTVGKILNDPSLYDEAKALMTQMKDAVASVGNHQSVVHMDAPATPERILLACERVRAQARA